MRDQVSISLPLFGVIEANEVNCSLDTYKPLP